MSEKSSQRGSISSDGARKPRSTGVTATTTVAATDGTAEIEQHHLSARSWRRSEAARPA